MVLKESKFAVAFIGVGIFVESGIAPFWGENEIWNKYKAKFFEINYFSSHTKRLGNAL
jgi:NAD-dependent deacetylase